MFSSPLAAKAASDDENETSWAEAVDDYLSNMDKDTFAERLTYQDGIHGSPTALNSVKDMIVITEENLRSVEKSRGAPSGGSYSPLEREKIRRSFENTKIQLTPTIAPSGSLMNIDTKYRYDGDGLMSGQKVKATTGNVLSNNAARATFVSRGASPEPLSSTRHRGASPEPLSSTSTQNIELTNFFGNNRDRKIEFLLKRIKVMDDRFKRLEKDYSSLLDMCKTNNSHISSLNGSQKSDKKQTLSLRDQVTAIKGRIDLLYSNESFRDQIFHGSNGNNGNHGINGNKAKPGKAYDKYTSLGTQAYLYDKETLDALIEQRVHEGISRLMSEAMASQTKHILKSIEQQQNQWRITDKAHPSHPSRWASASTVNSSHSIEAVTSTERELIRLKSDFEKVKTKQAYVNRIYTDLRDGVLTRETKLETEHRKALNMHTFEVNKLMQSATKRIDALVAISTPATDKVTDLTVQCGTQLENLENTRIRLEEKLTTLESSWEKWSSEVRSECTATSSRLTVTNGRVSELESSIHGRVSELENGRVSELESSMNGRVSDIESSILALKTMTCNSHTDVLNLVEKEKETKTQLQLYKDSMEQHIRQMVSAAEERLLSRQAPIESTTAATLAALVEANDRDHTELTHIREEDVLALEERKRIATELLQLNESNRKMKGKQHELLDTTVNCYMLYTTAIHC